MNRRSLFGMLFAGLVGGLFGKRGNIPIVVEGREKSRLTKRLDFERSCWEKGIDPLLLDRESIRKKYGDGPCWIPVTELLPPSDEWVWVYRGGNLVSLARCALDDAVWLLPGEYVIRSVSHWMPIWRTWKPDPPYLAAQ